MEFCERRIVNYQYWFGTEASKYGYGAMLEGFRSGLPADVELHGQASVAVLMYNPSLVHGFLRGQHRALYTMWETTQLPEKYYRYLETYDQVIVPCEHNRELFAQYSDNVSVVPLGVDIDYWKPTPRPANSRFRSGASVVNLPSATTSPPKAITRVLPRNACM